MIQINDKIYNDYSMTFAQKYSQMTKNVLILECIEEEVNPSRVRYPWPHGT